MIRVQSFFSIFVPINNFKEKIMKMKNLKAASLLLAGTLLTTSCVGSFALFNKLASWNKSATNSKFLNEIIFLVISPAYSICTFADVLVLNSIEFWSGKNPLASRIGKTQQVLGPDGKYYAVKTLKNGYEITKPNGEKMLFTYDKATNSWSQEKDGQKSEIFRFNPDGTIQASLPDGKKMDVTLDEAGVYQTKMAVNEDSYWAMR